MVNYNHQLISSVVINMYDVSDVRRHDVSNVRRDGCGEHDVFISKFICIYCIFKLILTAFTVVDSKYMLIIWIERSYNFPLDGNVLFFFITRIILFCRASRFLKILGFELQMILK